MFLLVGHTLLVGNMAGEIVFVCTELRKTTEIKTEKNYTTLEGRIAENCFCLGELCSYVIELLKS